MRKIPYECRCTHCLAGVASQISQEHRMLNQLVITLDEKQRRQFVGLLAKQYGYGGIEHMSRITGLHRATITRGQNELESEKEDDGRVRAKGGGRHMVEKKNPDCSQF